MVELIPEKNIIMLAPHYDDVPLMYAGFLKSLASSGTLDAHQIKIINIFSRSNYQARDEKGNADFSNRRLQHATGIRLMEDINCLDELIGHGNYSYELLSERECVYRGKGFKEGEQFEFPWGDRASFEPEEINIHGRLTKLFCNYLLQSNTAIFVPLGMKEHIDHIIVREAVLDAFVKLGKSVNAQIYIGEDLPYTGLASDENWVKANLFLAQFKWQLLDFPVDANAKASLVEKYYPSQVEDSYREGVMNRARQLNGHERLYRIESKNK